MNADVGHVRGKKGHAIVLYDGVCNLCDASVRFIIRHDQRDIFRFAPLQSPVGREIAEKYAISIDLSTFYLIKDDQLSERSDAWIRILTEFGRVWTAVRVLYIVPRPIRDLAYEFVGKNRYRWFGKKEYCASPDPRLKDKFLA